MNRPSVFDLALCLAVICLAHFSFQWATGVADYAAAGERSWYACFGALGFWFQLHGKAELHAMPQPRRENRYRMTRHNPNPTGDTLVNKTRLMWLTLAVLAIAGLFALPASAKDIPVTGVWSGAWADDAGQHRCSLQISDAAPTRLTIQCQLGADGGGFADVSPAPPSGWEIYLRQPVAAFASTPAGEQTWGQVVLFGFCDAGPAIYMSATSAPSALWITLRPVTVPKAASICGPFGLGG